YMQVKAITRYPDLLHRQIYVGPRSFGKTAVLDVFDNADHSPTRSPQLHLVTDRLLPFKIPSCECLIDNRHERRLTVVAVGKIAPCDECNAHEIEVSRPNRVHANIHVLAAARYVAADPHIALWAISEAKRHIIGKTHGPDSCQGLDASAQAPHDQRAL